MKQVASALPDARQAASGGALVVGIDCAVNPRSVGLALGSWSGETVQVEDLTRGPTRLLLAQTIEAWIRSASRLPVLLALDAPLGWPAALTKSLANHQAGQALSSAALEMFRRRTDDFVHETIGKRPLDVGADRIARTAHAALGLLEELRRRLDSPIPLAWNRPVSGVAAIEVYPAATMRAHGIQTHAYKHASGGRDRRRILRELALRMSFEAGVLDREYTSDEIDSAVCLLAAQDFLGGDVRYPPDRALAEREGWIWVRGPSRGAG